MLLRQKLIAGELKTFLSLLHKSVLNHPEKPFSSSCLLRFAEQNKQQEINKDEKAIKHRRADGGSYLEEILIEREEEPKTTGQKVKRAAANTIYFGIGLASLASLSILGYLVFREFFAFNTPGGVYRDAVKRVKSDTSCENLFGSRILAYGEESGRGRRRRIAHTYFFGKEGEPRLRIMFHIKGERIGRVLAEIAKSDENWDYVFLIAETEGYPKDAIILIDNRK